MGLFSDEELKRIRYVCEIGERAIEQGYSVETADALMDAAEARYDREHDKRRPSGKLIPLRRP